MANQTNAPLPEGLEVGGYRIVRKIASGGFSIVYLADDPDGQPVALKEYLPSSLVRRGPGELVPSVANENQSTYRNGLKCFFEEGRALAKVARQGRVRYGIDRVSVQIGKSTREWPRRRSKARVCRISAKLPQPHEHRRAHERHSEEHRLSV
jgi:serine/threonine protein kinase